MQNADDTHVPVDLCIPQTVCVPDSISRTSQLHNSTHHWQQSTSYTAKPLMKMKQTQR